MQQEYVQSLVADTAASYGVDPALALALASQESNYNQDAVSRAGAVGVMQLEPGTAAQLGVNPYDVTQNVRGGVTYLQQQLTRFGDPAQALAAYNWGPANVARAVASYGADWLSHAPSETRAYVARILGAATAAGESITAAVEGTAAVDGGDAGTVAAPVGLLVAGLALGAYLFFS